MTCTHQLDTVVVARVLNNSKSSRSRSSKYPSFLLVYSIDYNFMLGIVIEESFCKHERVKWSIGKESGWWFYSFWMNELKESYVWMHLKLTKIIKLNETYNKLFITWVQPGCEDFKDDLDDVHTEHGKSSYLSDCNFCLWTFVLIYFRTTLVLMSEDLYYQEANCKTIWGKWHSAIWRSFIQICVALYPPSFLYLNF